MVGRSSLASCFAVGSRLAVVIRALHYYPPGLAEKIPAKRKPALKIRGQPEASSDCPLWFSLRTSRLIYIERDPRKVVIRRPDTFVVGRADFDCYERPSAGGSLIRGASACD